MKRLKEMITGSSATPLTYGVIVAISAGFFILWAAASSMR